MTALADRVAMVVERADFDDLVTLVTQAPTWEKDRLQGVRILLRALADGKADAPEQILARWTWRLARATRKVQDRRASAEFPEAKRLLGALANSRGHRHEENAAKLVNAALEQPVQVGAALLASAEGYTPRANQLIDAARERIAPLLVIGFLAGVVTAISPCVLPVLPILLAGGASGGRRRPYAIIAGLVVSFVLFTLGATWLVDRLGLPDDLLRNIALGLLFLVAATLLVPQ